MQKALSFFNVNPAINLRAKNKPKTKNRFRFILVGRGGFEPPKSLSTDLQSVPFGHSGTFPYIKF